jgi:hypothetical protein
MTRPGSGKGRVYRAIQKDGGELSAEIDRIIGMQDESA